MYRIDYVKFNLELALPQLSIIESKSWTEFFVCSPNQKVPPDNGHSLEPEQGAYLNLAQQWADAEPANQSWFQPVAFAGWLCFGLVTALVIGCIVLRVRKNRRRGAAKVGTSKSSSQQRMATTTTTTTVTKTTTITTVTETSGAIRNKATIKTPTTPRKSKSNTKKVTIQVNYALG